MNQLKLQEKSGCQGREVQDLDLQEAGHRQELLQVKVSFCPVMMKVRDHTIIFFSNKYVMIYE